MIGGVLWQSLKVNLNILWVVLYLDYFWSHSSQLAWVSGKQNAPVCPLS